MVRDRPQRGGNRDSRDERDRNLLADAKERSQILGQTGRRNRTVDVLVKVRLLSGAEQWILLHVEVQTGYEEGFAQRVALYDSGRFWIFKQRVVTLAVLADLRDGPLPGQVAACTQPVRNPLQYGSGPRNVRADRPDDAPASGPGKTIQAGTR